jgi:hypothetical protein
MRRFLFAACLGAILAAGCGRQDSPDGARKNVQGLMERQLGQKMNASSPHTLAGVEGKLRKGMPIGEFDQFIAERNKGHDQSTKVMSSPFVGGDPPKADPKRQTRTYFLRDADLIVVTEFVGPEDEPEERVVSWRSEPVRGG